MRDVLDQIDRWRSEGKSIAVATVVKVWGSAPRPLGSKMVVSSDGEMAGSVSGGCVEGAVAEEARSVLETGEPKLVHFGVTDDRAWAVGLSCGGEIEVFIEALENEGIFTDLRACLEREELVVLATIVSGKGIGDQLLIWPAEQTLGDLGTPRLNQRAALFAEKAFQSFESKRRTIEHEGEQIEIFFDVHPPPEQLVIVGAVHVAIHLIELARALGFRTIVIDPRTAFATPERFAAADRLIAEWPAEALADLPINESTYFVTLSHDFKIDLPALEIALAGPARYVGALGSTRTHKKRIDQLLELGLTQEQIDRIHAPIGLDLGGRRAEEIALAIAAQMVAARHGRAL